jgi:two-component system nitrate/nitrite sensor histidine kinase NarX
VTSLNRRGGLRTKIILWFLIPTAIILSAVAVLTFTASRRVTEELVLARNADRTQLLANQLSEMLLSYRAGLSVFLAQISAWSPAALQADLEAAWPVGALAAFDAGVVLLDSDGEILAAVPAHAAFDDVGLSRLAVTGVVVGDDNLNVSNIVHSPALDDHVVALVQPHLVFDDGLTQELKGTLVGLIRVNRTATRTSAFYQDIWRLYIGRRYYTDQPAYETGSLDGGLGMHQTAYLIDGEGAIIFHPDTYRIGETVELPGTVSVSLSGAVRTTGLNGEEVVAAFSPLPRTSWTLVTEEDWSAILRTSRPYTRFMLLLLALGVIVPVALVSVGVRRITHPVVELTEAAEAVAGGDFDQTIEVHTGDELESLAHQFNLMAEELAASYAHLEQRVADRTRELATLNTIASVVSRSLELEQVLQTALEATLDAMAMEAGAAFRLEEEAGALHLVASMGLSDIFVRRVSVLHVAGARAVLSSDSVAAQALRRAEVVVRSVAAYSDGPLKRWLQEEGLEAVVGIPLIAKDAVVGVLNLATREPRPLTSEACEMLSAIGRQVGVAVENARLYGHAEMVAAMAERNRLARELHDAVSQTLFTASLIAEVIPELWKTQPAEAERQLQTVRRLTRGAQAEMRSLLMELRPSALVEAELETLLGQLSRAVAGRANVEVDLDLAPMPWVTPDVKVALYRIAQEALNNVVKHANASRATISLHSVETGVQRVVNLAICDNGCGFDVATAPRDHFGLGTMRERAEGIGATLSIETAPGQGTCIVVAWTVTQSQMHG